MVNSHLGCQRVITLSRCLSISYRNYALLLEGTHRKVNAQSDVYLGEWTPVVKEYYRYLDDVMQEMKIDGVKVTVR